MKKTLFAEPVVIEGDCLFLSDAHLGAPTRQHSLQREESLIHLIENLSDKIQHLFLLGDIFDFWFEYKHVVPKGHFRFFNTLYNLNQKGVSIYYFTGNHDMWVQSYFTESFNCRVFHREQAFVLNGKRCVIGHGDGLGGKQYRYRFIKWIFNFGPDRVLYSMLHPRQAFAIAQHFSKTSRASHTDEVFIFRNEGEHQVQYARNVLATENVDFFIFGHRHIPTRYPLNDHSTFFNTGDWLNNFSYILFNPNEKEPTLHYYSQETLSNKEN